MNATNVPITAAVDTAIGSIAYFMTGQQTSVSRLGAIGEIAPFTLDAVSNSRVVRGVVGTDCYTQITATGNATYQTLGAVSSSQYLYANLHVFAASGTTPSITVKIQSDDNTGFSSPTDRITFTAATGKTSEAKSVAGAITDTHYRVNYTVSGTSPKFLVLCTMGIA